MTPNEIRQKMPVGRNVHVQMNDSKAPLYVTVVEHFHGQDGPGVIVGDHPNLLSLPYDEIVGIS